VATGVQVRSGNATFTLKARKEVIVAGGVFQSPQLLQVSGVGPKDLLRKRGIPIVADRPGVGQNMNDQIFSDIVYRVNIPTASTLGTTEADIVLYHTNATGPLTNPGGEYGGFENVPADLRSGFSKTTAQSNLSLPAYFLLRLSWLQSRPRTVPLRLARNPVSLSSPFPRRPRYHPTPK
jgi:choline dehydrogenase